MHFRSTSFKIDLKEKKQKFWNLMYIMLIKACCSSFSAVAACTFDWLTDRRSLIKTKLNRLINNVCFPVRSITEKAKHGSYSVKVHSEKYSTWYMKAIWKIQYKFADTKINWNLLDGTRPDSHVTALWTFHIVKDDIYFLPYRFTNINFCH